VTREERAQQLWSILVLAARNRQVFTYEIISQACGVPAPSIGDFLRPIQQYCSENSFPPLTSIVVNKSSGLPGEGFIAAPDVPRAHISVFAKNWLEEQTPSAELFAEAYTRAPDRR
jgi:putative restriction endonuclease